MVQREEELKDSLLCVANSNGLEPTEFFGRIVKAKMNFGIGLRCPCDRDNPERFCISKRCMQDVQEKGTCHCNCWRKK